MPTSVTSKLASQSASCSSRAIVVPNVRVCCSRRRRLLPLPGTRTVATTLSRCTSSPAQRNEDVHHVPPLQTTGHAGSEGPPVTILRFALKAAVDDSAGPRAILILGLAAPRERRRPPITAPAFSPRYGGGRPRRRDN